MEKDGGVSYAGITSSVRAYRRSPGLAIVKSPSSALMNCALWDYVLIRCASEERPGLLALLQHAALWGTDRSLSL